MKHMMKKAIAILSIAGCVLTATAIGTLAAAKESTEIKIECESADYTATKAGGGALDLLKTGDVKNKDNSVHTCAFFSYNKTSTATLPELGDKIEYTVNADQAGVYSVAMAYRLNDNYYSTIQLSVNGTAVGEGVSTAGDAAVGADDNQVVTTPVGAAELSKGQNTITVEFVGLAADANKR